MLLAAHHPQWLSSFCQDRRLCQHLPCPECHKSGNHTGPDELDRDKDECLSTRESLSTSFHASSSTPAYRPGEEHSGVIVLRVAVTRWVVLPLPLAEVAQGHGRVRWHLRASLLLVHHQELHHRQADGVVDARVAVEAGCHCHDRQEVRFEPSAVELSHGLVSHQHDLQVARGGNETPGPVVSWGERQEEVRPDLHRPYNQIQC